MYNLTSVKVVAEASLNYQKFCVEFTAEIEDDNDLQNLRQYANNEALKGVLELSKSVEPYKKPDEQPKPVSNKPRQYTPNNQQPRQVYQAPRASQPVQQGVRMASPKQLDYLRSFGYNGDGNLTFQQADQLLQQYKQQM